MSSLQQQQKHAVSVLRRRIDKYFNGHNGAVKIACEQGKLICESSLTNPDDEAGVLEILAAWLGQYGGQFTSH